jgi:hypothetical protein
VQIVISIHSAPHCPKHVHGVYMTRPTPSTSSSRPMTSLLNYPAISATTLALTHIPGKLHNFRRRRIDTSNFTEYFQHSRNPLTTHSILHILHHFRHPANIFLIYSTLQFRSYVRPSRLPQCLVRTGEGLDSSDNCSGALIPGVGILS